MYRNTAFQSSKNIIFLKNCNFLFTAVFPAPVWTGCACVRGTGLLAGWGFEESVKFHGRCNDGKGNDNYDKYRLHHHGHPISRPIWRIRNAAAHARIMVKSAEKAGHFHDPDSLFMVARVATQGTYRSMKII
jgi:hypothetical protein